MTLIWDTSFRWVLMSCRYPEAFAQLCDERKGSERRKKNVSSTLRDSCLFPASTDLLPLFSASAIVADLLRTDYNPTLGEGEDAKGVPFEVELGEEGVVGRMGRVGM